MKRKLKMALAIIFGFALAGVLIAKTVIEEGEAKITGSGTLKGGTYKRIIITGSGKIEGSVVADEFRNRGKAEVAGNVKTKELNSDGNLKISQTLNADYGETGGFLKVSGKVSGKELRFAGSAIIGSLEGNTIFVGGSLNVDRGVNAKFLKVIGSLKVGENIKANEFSIRMDSNCSVKQIKAKKIEVNRGPVGLISKRIFSADRIEADEIDLQNTESKLVKGKLVKIGPGCRIDTVEYKQSIEIDKDASVKNKLKR